MINMENIQYPNWYKKNIHKTSDFKKNLEKSLIVAAVMFLHGIPIAQIMQKLNLDNQTVNEAVNNPEILEQAKKQLENKNNSFPTTPTSKLLNNLKLYEGTKQYQQQIGTFKNDKFYPYTDSEGFLTIGYGHKVLPNEKILFSSGISEEKANSLLKNDAQFAVNATNRILKNYNINNIDNNAHQIITEMVYQMGENGVSKFKNTLNALKNQNYDSAADHMLISTWANQTPNRARSLSERMRSL